INHVSFEKITKAIATFLRDTKNLYVECLSTEAGFLVQARETDDWKNIAGLGVATHVQIIPSGNTVTISIGAGKWLDKAGVATIGMIVFSPLILTAAIGAYNQTKLPDEIFTYIEQFLMSGGQTASVSLSKAHALNKDEVQCSKCHTLNPKANKFCLECGSKLGTPCSKCGETLPENVKFCPQCGSPIQKLTECPECHAPVSENQNFCFQCGKPLTH
ncbi:MAG: zinc ribbon domain-containing protein, partial [Clostridium sp.]|nr:zinc ribbon domain-containing protein [Clostridium sp.]